MDFQQVQLSPEHGAAEQAPYLIVDRLTQNMNGSQDTNVAPDEYLTLPSVLSKLPLDVLRLIWAPLGLRDKHALRLVCKELNRLLNEAISKATFSLSVDDTKTGKKAEVLRNRFRCLVSLTLAHVTKTNASKFFEVSQHGEPVKHRTVKHLRLRGPNLATSCT